MQSRPWTCPHCNGHCTIDNTNTHDANTSSYECSRFGKRRIAHLTVVVCLNPECGRESVYVGLESTGSRPRYNLIIPRVESNAKLYPNYIPLQIRQDYEEACAIKDLSPKSSATLCRRCLQGIIRDFWSVGKTENKTLSKQIKKLREMDTVPEQMIEGLDAVREIGNIGAHMEKDVNLIIDIDPGEAEQLIHLIEMLIEDWYIARYKKQEKLKKIKEINADKQKQKGGDHEKQKLENQESDFPEGQN